ncbi:MAG: hypothetical protein RL016_45, partial [Actinomycetota bacterium]
DQETDRGKHKQLVNWHLNPLNEIKDALGVHLIIDERPF